MTHVVHCIEVLNNGSLLVCGVVHVSAVVVYGSCLCFVGTYLGGSCTEYFLYERYRVFLSVLCMKVTKN